MAFVGARNILSYGLARTALGMVKFLQGGFPMITCPARVDKEFFLYHYFSSLFCKNRTEGKIRRALDNNELFRMVMIVPPVLVSCSLRKLINKSTSSSVVVPRLSFIKVFPPPNN